MAVNSRIWPKVGYIIFLLAWSAFSLIASQFIVALIFQILLGSQVTQPLWTAACQFCIYILALALTILIPPHLAALLHRNHKLPASYVAALQPSRQELGLSGLPSFTDIGLAPIGYIVSIVLAQLCLNFMQNFSWFVVDQAQDAGFSFFSVGLDRVITVVALVFVAPIAEEILMRGWLYGKLRQQLKFIPAALLVSFLFGFLHGQWNVAISTFILSFVMCSMREMTGTIWSTIILHILFNGVAFYVSSQMPF